MAGGHALTWPDTREFNLRQDVPAARVVLDCGVPLVLVPCMGVTSHLLTSVPEIDRHVAPHGELGAFLAARFKEMRDDHIAWSRVLWDVATIAYLLNSDWVPTELVPSPIVTDQVTWSVDRRRHLIRCASFVHRDPIYRDLFRKLAANAAAA